MPSEKKNTTFSPLPTDDSKLESGEVLRKSYTDFNILGQPVSADMLIERWSYDRSEVSNNMNHEHLNNIFNDIFPSDKTCKGCLGEGGLPHVIRSSCVGCQLLTRLFTAGEEGHTRTLTIQTGENQGKKYYISYIPSSTDSLTGYANNNSAAEYGKKILSKLNDMLVCEKGFSSRIKDTITFSTRSKLSNYITASCIIEAEMRAADMPGLPIFRWVYDCKNGSIMVEEDVPDRGTLNGLIKYKSYMNSDKTQLRSDVVRLILSQLVMNLSFLSNYDFTHGKPSMNSIIVVNEPCSMKYDGIRLESPFTVHLIPSEYTNMTINVSDKLIRTYCSDNYTPDVTDQRLISNFNFTSHLRKSSTITPCSPAKCISGTKRVNPTLKDFKSIRVMSYKLGDGDSYDIYTNKLGIALFPSSFDIYAFFVSLMTIEQFYFTVLSDNDLKKIWSNMWLEEEYHNVMEEIHHMKGMNVSYYTIKNMLSKFYLRCDGLIYIWEALKNLSAIN